ncbi:hypothetical protein PC119_g18731 [Phytophthora cactorum]|nr:hypothetical protein PC119_g18731 [Phytophthora cactorum]
MSDALSKVSNKTSQVPFGRLEPSERSARTVLTHAEKYNIARSLFDPVIDRLSRLSSAKFYKQVQDWEMIITKATDAEQFVCPSTMRKAVEMNQTLAQHASLTSLLDADGYFLERGDLIDVREDLGEALSTTDSTQIPRVPLASQPKLIQQTDGFAAGKEVLVQDTHFVCIIDASKA